ncbi:MAG: cytochrome c-type biogenesis protein CcmH [Ktedonobacterales bacterium]|nr:cytochrome c-type biogenesis protein CcmH [Ktedonobacterales bacterium]
MRWQPLLRRPAFLISLALFLAVGAVWILQAVSIAPPPTLDERVSRIGSQIQCPVCSGESVADATSAQAQQIRALIRQQVAQGKTDQQIIHYFVVRYGEGILESPPKRGFTSLIWLAPLLMLLASIGIVTSAAREWHPAPATPAEDEESAVAAQLTPEERARLTDVLRRELAADEGLSLTPGMEGA